jgi:uncharacterized protein YbjT (DUF2867 family)
MRVVVTTPTGNIGRVVAERLLDGGADVVLPVRDPAKVQDLADRGATVLQGDLTDEGFVIEATRASDCVFWLTPPNYGAEDHRAWQVALGANAAAAVKANGIPRVVHLSSVGAHVESGTGPILGLRRNEELLDEVAESITHLRPTYFMENLLGSLETIKEHKSIFLSIPGDLKCTWIATRDIGEFAAKRILDEGWTGRSEIEICGPGLLSHREAAEILSEELGEAVSFVEVSSKQVFEALTGMGMTESAARDLVEVSDAVGSGRVVPIQDRTPENTTPTSFRDFAREVIVPLLKGTTATS